MIWMPCCRLCSDGCLICDDWETEVAQQCGWTQESGTWSIDTVRAETPDSRAILQNQSVGGNVWMNLRTVVTVTRNAASDVIYILFRDAGITTSYGVKIGAGLVEMVEVDTSGDPWVVTVRTTKTVPTPAGAMTVWLCQQDLNAAVLPGTELVTATIPSLSTNISMPLPLVPLGDSVALATGTITGATSFSKFGFFHGYTAVDYPECSRCFPGDVPPPSPCPFGCTTNPDPIGNPQLNEICDGFNSSSYIRYLTLYGVADGTCSSGCNTFNGQYTLCLDRSITGDSNGHCAWLVDGSKDYGETPCSPINAPKSLKFIQDRNPGTYTVLDAGGKPKGVTGFWIVLIDVSNQTDGLVYVAGTVDPGAGTEYVAPIAREFDTYNDLWGGTLHLARPAPDDCVWSPTVSVAPGEKCQPSICSRVSETYPAQELEVSASFFNRDAVDVIPPDGVCTPDCGGASGTYVLRLQRYGDSYSQWGWDFQLASPVICKVFGIDHVYNWLRITSQINVGGGNATLQTDFFFLEVDDQTGILNSASWMGCGNFELVIQETQYFCSSAYTLPAIPPIADPSTQGCCQATGNSQWLPIGWSG